mgnify:CR=1 FL=1
MLFIQRYWVLLLICGVAAFVYLNDSTSSNDGTPTTSYNDPQQINLKHVLDITIDTIYAFEKMHGDKMKEVAADSADTSELDNQALWTFVEDLKTAYNSATPAISSESIGVQPMMDASFIGFKDSNLDDEWDDKLEDALFQIELDGDRSRVIATSNTGAVDEHRVSGMPGFFTGYFMGSLLGRQAASGVKSSDLAAKKPVSAKAAARARAGSGSYSRGK